MVDFKVHYYITEMQVLTSLGTNGLQQCCSAGTQYKASQKHCIIQNAQDSKAMTANYLSTTSSSGYFPLALKFIGPIFWLRLRNLTKFVNRVV